MGGEKLFGERWERALSYELTLLVDVLALREVCDNVGYKSALSAGESWTEGFRSYFGGGLYGGGGPLCKSDVET